MVNLAVIFIVLILVDVVIMKIDDGSDESDDEIEKRRKQIEEEEDAKKLKKIRKKHDSRSTSSSEGKKAGDGSNDADNSLDLSDSGRSVSKTGEKKNLNVPKSSEERTGWRKWHRKCTRCLEDEKMKWRDPSIKWICGAYQRARRSFKSECMMYYRNCQDGTMFIKIRNHRCEDDTANDIPPHGDHFFYEYKVALDDEEHDSAKSNSDEDKAADGSSSY